MKKSLLIWPLAICLYSCAGPSGPISQSFDEACWEATDTLTKSWSPSASGDYLAQIHGAYDPEYRYQNIHFRLEVISPSGKSQVLIVSDTLMDELGVWEDDSYESVSVPVTLHVDKPVQHTLRLSHYMRTDKLCEVKSVTLLDPVSAQ